MLAGRTAAPLPPRAPDGSIRIADRPDDRGFVIIEAVPGAVPVAELVADLHERGRRPPLWARLAPFDLDPPALHTLAFAVLDRDGLDGETARRDGGPPAGGRAAGGAPAVAVVESPDTPRACAFLDQVSPALGHRDGARQVDRVVLHLLADGAETTGSKRDPRGVEWDQQTAALLDDPQIGPRLATLLAGRPGLLHNLVQVDALIGRPTLTSAVRNATAAEQLTRLLGRALIGQLGPDHGQRLRLAALLGYAHERLAILAPLLDNTPACPWWIPLEGGWYQIDAAWRTALAAAEDRSLPVAGVAALAGALLELGAPEEAVELSLDAACPGLASDLLAELSPALLAAEHTRELQRWLRRLPPKEHARHAPLLARLGPLPPADPGPATAYPLSPTPHRRRWRARGRHRTPLPIRLAPHSPNPSGPTSTAATSPAPAAPAPTPQMLGHPGLGPTPNGPPTPAARPASTAALTIEVRLLGAVEVRIDGRAVRRWHGNVGRTALAYVLLQRRRVPPHELAHALWPDTPLKTARNRLHVALCHLRTDLATLDPRPVLVHQQGYTIDPSLRLDLDTDRFEHHASAGDDATATANSSEALTAYLAALDCYGGELLGGERDDDWALLGREHYRVRLLDVLGKAAHLALDLDRPALTVELGHRLLGLDFCREDLHRLLMHAYARLGQPHLALRQFQACARQLRLEFDLDPTSETIELYKKLRSPTSHARSSADTPSDLS